MDQYYNDIYAIASTRKKAMELIEEMRKRRKEGDSSYPCVPGIITYETDVILKDN